MPNRRYYGLLIAALIFSLYMAGSAIFLDVLLWPPQSIRIVLYMALEILSSVGASVYIGWRLYRSVVGGAPLLVKSGRPVLERVQRFGIWCMNTGYVLFMLSGLAIIVITAGTAVDSRTAWFLLAPLLFLHKLVLPLFGLALVCMESHHLLTRGGSRFRDGLPRNGSV